MQVSQINQCNKDHKQCLAWKVMAKTQNHECEGTKGHKHLEKNGEGGSFTVGRSYTNLYCCLTDNREKKENGPMGVVLREIVGEILAIYFLRTKY